MILIANKHQTNFSNNEEFISSWSDLGIDLGADSEHYRYNQYQLNDAQVVVTASAQESGLKSYSAIVFLVESPNGEILPDFAICQTIDISKISPQNIQLLETEVMCPSGSEAWGNFHPNGTILLTFPEEQPEESSSETIATNLLTQSQAIDIVNSWLRAKPRIFGPPFDRNLLASLATGECYRDNIGSINWLVNNDYHYTYAVSRIENVWAFTSSTFRPSLKVSVYEDLTLHGPNGIDWSKSGSSTRNFVYYFAQDSDGSWKVEDYGRVE